LVEDELISLFLDTLRALHFEGMTCVCAPGFLDGEGIIAATV
jgi:hypothetical protein